MATSETGGERVFGAAGVFATGPMLYDILAIQHLYCANMNVKTGNDIASQASGWFEGAVLAGEAAADAILSTHPS